MTTSGETWSSPENPMKKRTRRPRLSRRRFIKIGAMAVGASALPSVTMTSAQPRSVPRTRTLTLVWSGSREGRWIDYELWNPYAIGSNHQNGPGIFYEPLAYYSAFADKEYLWLAESYKYSPDLNALKELGPKVRWGVDVQQFMQEARTSAPNTVVIKFKVPAPRFFYFMTYKYDIGVYIVPKHIFQGQDWTTFKHFDTSKDWPVTTSPWKVVFSSPQQKVVDRRDEWWAAKAGLAPMPKVERNIWLPSVGEQQNAQALIANQLDYAGSLQPATFQTIFRQNPKIITHSGQSAPYGYMDWWPISLYVNNEKPPFNDKDVRWALSHFIDRQQIIDVGYLGASVAAPLPLPDYPGLRPYIASAKDLLAKYNTLEFNPKKGEEILQRKGWKKDTSGTWTDAQRKPFTLDIIGTGSTGPAIGPVLSELLKRQGVAASMSLPPDFDDRFQKGQYNGAIYGHGGSVNDPYPTLRLYQSVSVAVPGAHLVNFAKWKNEAYNKIVDDVFVTDMSNKTRLTELFRKAMEIWIPELPDIPLVHNFHRIPMNTTFWTNWPTEQNPYVNGAFWHLTYAMVLWNLQPTQ